MTATTQQTEATLIEVKKAVKQIAAQHGVECSDRDAEMMAMIAGIAALKTEAATGAPIKVSREGMLAILDRNRKARA